MKHKMFHLILTGLAFYGGLAALGMSAGWIPAMAVFVMFCAHNAEYHPRKP